MTLQINEINIYPINPKIGEVITINVSTRNINPYPEYFSAIINVNNNIIFNQCYKNCNSKLEPNQGWIFNTEFFIPYVNIITIDVITYHPIPGDTITWEQDDNKKIFLFTKI